MYFSPPLRGADGQFQYLIPEASLPIFLTTHPLSGRSMQYQQRLHWRWILFFSWTHLSKIRRNANARKVHDHYGHFKREALYLNYTSLLHLEMLPLLM